MGDETKRDSWFVRAAAAVGDLGNLFYREERRRDVWNEASAVGFQLMLWLGLAAAAAMIWIGGPPALPYVVVSASTLWGAVAGAVLVLGLAGWTEVRARRRDSAVDDTAA